MDKSIDKGARFRFLTGDYRGAIGTVQFERCTGREWYLNCGDGTGGYFTTDDLSGPKFQRLADDPTEPDTTAAEILTMAVALRRLYHDRSQSDAAYGAASEAFWKRIDALGGKS